MRLVVHSPENPKRESHVPLATIHASSAASCKRATLSPSKPHPRAWRNGSLEPIWFIGYRPSARGGRASREMCAHRGGRNAVAPAVEDATDVSPGRDLPCVAVAANSARRSHQGA